MWQIVITDAASKCVLLAVKNRWTAMKKHEKHEIKKVAPWGAKITKNTKIWKSYSVDLFVLSICFVSQPFWSGTLFRLASETMGKKAKAHSALASLQQLQATLAAKKSEKDDGKKDDTPKVSTPEALPSAPPPAVRVRAKSSRAGGHAESTPAEPAQETKPKKVTKPREKKPPAKTEQVSPPEDVPVTWENFDRIKEGYELSDSETHEVLLKVVGPRVTMVKEELDSKRKHDQETVVEEPSVKRPRWKDYVNPNPILPDNQLGDLSLFPDETVADEGEEEECIDEDGELDGDPFDDDDMIAVAASGGNGNDPDSPSPGCTVGEPSKEVVVRPQPEEPVEAIIETVVSPKDDLAKQAKDDLENALKVTPTPSKKGSTRVIQHHVKRLEEDELEDSPRLQSMLPLSISFLNAFLWSFHHSSNLFIKEMGLKFNTVTFLIQPSSILRSCPTLTLGQQHLTRQASSLNLGNLQKADSDVDTEYFDNNLRIMVWFFDG